MCVYTAAGPQGRQVGTSIVEKKGSMRLTSFSDYALRVLLFAASKGDALATIEETANVFDVSRAHLKKVVLLLVRAGFLTGTRGRHGGFALARAPADIRLGDVIRVTEPDFGLVECFLPGNQCLITRRCGLPSVLNEALTAFLTVLDGRSLADVMVEQVQFAIPAPATQPLRGPVGARPATAVKRP